MTDERKTEAKLIPIGADEDEVFEFRALFKVIKLFIHLIFSLN